MDNLDKIGVVLEVAKSYDLPVTESKDNLPQLVFLIRDEQFRLPPQCTLAEYFNPIVRDHYIGYKVLVGSQRCVAVKHRLAKTIFFKKKKSSESIFLSWLLCYGCPFRA